MSNAAMLTNYAIVDTETGGLSPQAMPWEIAVLRYDGIAQNWNRLLIHVEDYNVFEMEPEAANLNGFFERYRNEPTAINLPARAAAQMLDHVLEGRIIVGSNPGFDQRKLLNLGCAGTWHHRSRDVPTMALGLLGQEPGGLQQTAAILAVERGPEHTEHTAMGDALLTLDVFLAILNADRG